MSRASAQAHPSALAPQLPFGCLNVSHPLYGDVFVDGWRHLLPQPLVIAAVVCACAHRLHHNVNHDVLTSDGGGACGVADRQSRLSLSDEVSLSALLPFS